MTHPHLYPGIKYNMNGNTDAFFVEGSDISTWVEAEQAWKLMSVVDVSGKTKPCRWNADTSRCS